MNVSRRTWFVPLHPLASGVLTSGLTNAGVNLARRCFPEDQRLERAQAVISSAPVAKGKAPAEPMITSLAEKESANQEETA